MGGRKRVSERGKETPKDGGGNGEKEKMTYKRTQKEEDVKEAGAWECVLHGAKGLSGEECSTVKRHLP